MKRIVNVSALALVAWTLPRNDVSAQTSLVLVVDGAPAATIVTAPKPTRAAQLAAHELQHHVRQITGATLPILQGKEEVNGVRVFVGESEATKALGFSAADLKAREYVIAWRPRTLVLMGRDKPDVGTVTYDMDDPASLSTWPGLWDEQATLYATYDFLERHCSVRWFTPTDWGADCPKTRTLRVEGRDVRRAPHFAFRDATGAMGDNGARYDAYVGLWPEASEGFRTYEAAAYPELHRRFPQPGRYAAAKRARVRLFQLRRRAGGEPARCNHSLYGFYARFWEKDSRDPDAFVRREPTWFAQGYEGRPPQMCYTSPGLVQQLAQDARDYFDGKKTGKDLRIFWQPTLPNPFPVEPMDNSFYCKCERCQAQLEETGADEPHFSKGTYSNYFFRFINAVAREVAKTHPDRYLVTLAYGTHAYLPTGFHLEPNVAVQFCFATNRSPHNRAGYEHELGLLRAWAAKRDRPLYLWLYYCFPVESANNGKYHCFPGFFAHAIGEQFKAFRECGVRGMFHCGYGQDVEAYVTYKLMDDPTLDVDAILDDYFTRLYGAAATPMKAFYLTIERTYCDPANYPKEKGTSGPALAWGHLGTEACMTRLAALLREGKRLATTDVEKRRVGLVEKGVWDYMVAGRTQFADRMVAPIPSLRAPRVAAAGGVPAKVDWGRAAALPGTWFDRGGAKPAARKFAGRVAHDGEFFYLQLTDPCDPKKLVTSASVFPYDDWEVFIAAQRAMPYRQYAVGPTGSVVALSHGEVNWRRNVRMEEHGIRATSDVSAPDRWVTRLAIPLKGSIPGGVAPGGTLYLNVIRVSSPAIGGQYPLSIDTWVSYCTVHEVDRLAAITLDVAGP